MRIISGKLKGRKLIDSSYLKDLRPTTDKNRQALFNILGSAKFLQEIDFSLRGANILDLCCGTGAVSFEALSRGALQALLVDKNPKHLDIAKENSVKLNLENEVRFLLCDAEKLPISNAIFDLVFIDPPYKHDAKKMVENLIEKKYVDKNSLIIIESDKNFENDLMLKLLDSRKYGITKINFFVLKYHRRLALLD